MIWEYGSRNTTKHFDILKAGLRNHDGYLMMLSASHDMSWSYFLTKSVASDNPEDTKVLVAQLLKQADVAH